MARHLLKKRLMWGMIIAIGMVISIVGSTLGSSALVATATTQPSYRIKDLGTLDRVYSNANDINNAGKVVGYSYISRHEYYGFLWEKGNKIDLGTLGGKNSSASAINNAGKVVGSSSISTTSNVSHAVLWEKGKIIDLGTLGGSYSNAISINNAGKVVGFSTISSGRSHAVLWDNNLIKDLNNLIAPKLGWELISASSINAKGQIVGFGYINDHSHAFLLTPVK